MLFIWVKKFYKLIVYIPSLILCLWG